MKFVGNCNTIDWSKLLEDLRYQEGKILTYKPSGNELDSLWKAAGYKHNDPAIEWIQYWSGQTFDQIIADQFGEWVGATPYYTFVSCVRVGKFIPFHVDQMKDQDNIPGTPVRYTCFMSGPISGHLSLVEDQVVHHTEIGDVWEWPSPSSRHSGVNVSDTDKWQFNFWGYK